MSAAANTFLRLNSTASQPGSPTSLKSGDKFSIPSTSGGTAGKSSGGGGNHRNNLKCGPALLAFFSSNPRIKKGLAHLSLVILLGLYTAAGASVRSISLSQLLLL